MGHLHASSGEQQGTFLSIGEEGRRKKRPENVRPIRDNRRGQKRRPGDHVGNEGALRVSRAPHEVDRWLAGLVVNFA